MTAEVLPYLPKWEFTENISARVGNLANDLNCPDRIRVLTRGVLAINETDRFLQTPLKADTRNYLLIYFLQAWGGFGRNTGPVARRYEIEPNDAVRIRNTFLQRDESGKIVRDIFLYLALDPKVRDDQTSASFFKETANLMLTYGPHAKAISRELSANIESQHRDRNPFDIDMAISHIIIEGLSSGTIEQKYERLKELGLRGDEIYRRLGQLELERMSDTGDALNDLILIGRRLRFPAQKIADDLDLRINQVLYCFKVAVREGLVESTSPTRTKKSKKKLSKLMRSIRESVERGESKEEIARREKRSVRTISAAITALGKSGVDTKKRIGPKPTKSIERIKRLKSLDINDFEAVQIFLEEMPYAFYFNNRDYFVTISQAAHSIGLESRQHTSEFIAHVEKENRIPFRKFESKNKKTKGTKGNVSLYVFLSGHKQLLERRFSSAPELQGYKKIK